VMNLAMWVVAMVGPMAFKLLTYLGIGLATIVGAQEAFDGLKGAMIGYMGGMPSAVVAIAGLAGFPTAIGIVWGAFNARLALWISLASGKWISTK